MYCGNCGNKIENENVSFCKKCGTKIIKTPKKINEPKKHITVNFTSIARKKSIKVVLAVIVLILTYIFINNLFFSEDATIKSYVKAYANNDYQKIIKLTNIDKNKFMSKESLTEKYSDKTNKYVKDSNGNDLEAKTTSTGFYSFDRVPKGQYLVVFEYDTTKYGLTTFEKQGVASTMTSKVINKNLKINNEEKNVATTEIINVDTENIANINIGLINAKTYDLQLDKYITKVTVQNNKTVTNEYNNQTLAKAEIDAKQVNSTTVVVEYTIKVTNKGDVTAYVKKIADYLSSDYKFSSELNKDWYQSGSDIYCTSLANEKLQPGESKEVKLTVIKQMKENNTGLVNNTAEIAESYNELGLKDKNSTEGNKVKGENDMGSADLIISIRTGQVVTTVLLVISSIVILGVAVYYVRRLITHRNFI